MKSFVSEIITFRFFVFPVVSAVATFQLFTLCFTNYRFAITFTFTVHSTDKKATRCSFSMRKLTRAYSSGKVLGETIEAENPK